MPILGFAITLLDFNSAVAVLAVSNRHKIYVFSDGWSDGKVRAKEVRKSILSITCRF